MCGATALDPSNCMALLADLISTVDLRKESSSVRLCHEKARVFANSGLSLRMVARAELPTGCQSNGIGCPYRKRHPSRLSQPTDSYVRQYW
jgi:hypothetical protein